MGTNPPDAENYVLVFEHQNDVARFLLCCIVLIYVTGYAAGS